MDPTYPLCLSDSESIIHALRDYSKVRNFWTQLGVEEVNSSFFSDNLHQWITINGKAADTKKHRDHPPWKTSFLFAIGTFGSIGTILLSITKPSNKTWVMRFFEKLWSTSTM